MVVTDVGDLAPGIRRLELASAAPLSSFVPGSHVLIRCGTHRYNAYSLTGPHVAPGRYSIAVQLDMPTGLRPAREQFGSKWLHDRTTGDEIDLSAPRSTFAPVASARKHLLIAGGIGVTPILSHARAAGPDAEVLYVHRPGAGAHADDLRSFCAATTVLTEREAFTDALRSALRRQPLGTHLYVCGPPALMSHVEQEAAAAGWPDSRRHRERFTTPITESRPFDIRVRSRTVHVPAESSALDALLNAGVSVPNLCRHGVCGECRTPVVAGAVEHRDLYLTEEERESGEVMMVCVSRAAGAGVEVDL